MRIRHHSAALLVVVVLVACNDRQAGSARSSKPLPKEFQGEWIFDRERFIEHLKQSAPNDEARVELLENIATLEGTGLPLHPDIVVEGNRIRGVRAILQPQYDLDHTERRDGKVYARALWHEDRHDPGDASYVRVVLYLTRNDGLVFELEEEPEFATFFFRRAR